MTGRQKVVLEPLKASRINYNTSRNGYRLQSPGNLQSIGLMFTARSQRAACDGHKNTGCFSSPLIVGCWLVKMFE